MSPFSLSASLLSQNLAILLRTTTAATNGNTGQIPVIDLSRPEAEAAKQRVDAAATYGFVDVKSLGKDIPVEDIDSIFALVTSSTRHIIMYHTNACTVKGILLFSH
jgi:hypothetical protein